MITDTLHPSEGTANQASAGFVRTLKAYVALTKPRVMELLLVVTVPAMILAARGVPSIWLVLATLLGGAMSAGSAGAFNCYIDRDMDRGAQKIARL